MSEERTEIAEEDAAKSLWRKYRKTPEYHSGRRYSISSIHPLIRNAEEQGLNTIILDFAKELEQPVEIRTRLASRNECIARVVTDQLSVSLGYIPIIAGFPRHNAEKKQIYHAAIHDCAIDSSYTALTEWIKFQLQQKLAEII